METLENVFHLLEKVHMLKKNSSKPCHIKAKVKAVPAPEPGAGAHTLTALGPNQAVVAEPES